MDNINSFNVKDALNILKNGGVVFTIIKNEPSFFKYENSLIFSFNNKSSFYISTDDFIELYVLNSFYLYEENNEETIDIARDNEYYSMNSIKK